MHLRSFPSLRGRIALFHSYFDIIGGAEIVSLTLARAFGADIFSTNVDYEKIRMMGFSDVRVHSIGTVPRKAPFRQQIASWKFRNLTLRRPYSFYIISHDWAVSAAVKHHPNLWYVHSPVREVWDLYPYMRTHIVPWHSRWAFDLWVAYHRIASFRYARYADTLVCNSRLTQQRIARYFKRHAVIVHPPIDTSVFSSYGSDDFWLSVNRLVPHKRVEIQLQAFTKLPQEKLLIVGGVVPGHPYMSDHWENGIFVPSNVTFLGSIDLKKLQELYSMCKGFITTAKDEDFGMTAVEAMAAGKPVIAPNEGGYRETVIHGKTGFLLKEITAQKLADAVKHVGTILEKHPLAYKIACQQQAKKFDVSVFIRKMKEQIHV